MRSAPAASASCASPSPSSSGSPSPLHANHQTSIDRCDEPLETHTRGRRGGRESRDRAAQPAPRARRNALGRRLRPGRGSSSSTSRARMASSSTRHWIASAPGPERAASSGREPLRHLVLQAEPTNARRGEQPHRTAHGDLPDPRVDVAADRADLEITRSARTWAARRRLLARRRRLPEGRRASCRRARQAIPHVLAPCHRADDDAGRVLGRQVLERVNREVDLAVAERSLELGREEPLAADLGKRLAARLRPVAGGPITRVSQASSGHALVSSPMTRSGLDARERRGPGSENTAACRGGALTDRSGRRGRTGRAWRRRSRPRSRHRLARVRGRSGREQLFTSVRERCSIRSTTPPGRPRPGPSAHARAHAADRPRLLAQLGEKRLDLELPVATAEVLHLSSTTASTFGTSRSRAAIAPSRPARRSSTSKSLRPRPRLPRARRPPERRGRRGRDGRRGSTSPPHDVGTDHRSSDDVAVMATSADASASSSSVRSCGPPEALGHLDRAVLRPVRDRDAREPAALGCLQRLQPDPTRPTTRMCFSRRSPSAPSASASAIELAVAGFAPIAVSRERGGRTRSPYGRGAPARRILRAADSKASRTCPRISVSPRTSESRPAATRHRCRATSSPAWT